MAATSPEQAVVPGGAGVDVRPTWSDGDLATCVAGVASVLARGLPARSVRVALDGGLADYGVGVVLPYRTSDAAVAAGLVAWAGVLDGPAFSVCRTRSGFIVFVRGALGGLPWACQGHLERSPRRGVPAKHFQDVPLEAAAVAELAAPAGETPPCTAEAGA
jgi:hypothetical protein